ncbi:MAG: response regulator [Lachnospiraceae bacterium]|nr:response regulator [Lachnospiraceae bacterium]
MQKDNEIRAVSHLALVITIIVFSFVLIILNISLGWEKWTIPLFLVAAMVCPILHITRKLSDMGRIYVYSAVFLVELFYYSVNVETIYDSTAVFAVALVIFAMTQEFVLSMLCMIVACVGDLWLFVEKGNAGELIFERGHVVRTVWHLSLIIIAGVVTSELLKAIKRGEDAKNERIRELEKETESASDFLANVSHEIRTPVNAVMGLTRVCMDMDTSTEMRDNLKAISDAGKRVGEQISDILDFSEIDMDKLAVNKEDYMPSSLLSDLAASVAPYKDDSIELIIDVAPDLPAIMNTDVSKLKKILWHLVMNGLKYTKEGGVYVHISPIKEKYGINMLIEVRDTGVGISPEELDRICDRFYQSNSGRNRSTNGLGLGLSIVSGFVRSLKGFMTIESEKGEGTTVRVSLPQTVVDETECMTLVRRETLSIGAYLDFDKYMNPFVREFYNNMLKDIIKGLKVSMHRVDKASMLKSLVNSVSLTHLFVAQQEYESCADYIDSLTSSMVVVVVADTGFKPNPGSKVRVMYKPFYCFPVISVLDSSIEDYENDENGRMYCRGVKALVVDDEPMNLIVATSFLGRYGMEVTTVSSGMEGIIACRENDFDVVFMDHMMPEMDGVEAMKRIRTEAERAKKTLPIVALTANAVSSAKEMFMREGFDGFISKPIEEAEFERVLKKVLPKNAVTFEQIMDTANPKRRASDKETHVTNSQPAEDEAAQEYADDIFGKLKAYGIDTSVGLGFCKEDEEFYKTLLMQYVKDGPDKRTRMTEFLKKDDVKNYEIVVHALKSSSKTIGAMDISESARLLEQAASNGDHEYISAHNDEMMTAYESLCENIGEVFGMEVDRAESHAVADDEEIFEFAPGEE